VLDPARFALHLAVHLLARYAHLGAAFVTVEQLRWARIGAAASGAGEEAVGHKHAFWRDRAEKRFVEVEVARKGDGNGAVARVAGGLRDLLGARNAPLFLRLSDGTQKHTPHQMDFYAALVGVFLRCSGRRDRHLRNLCGTSTRRWSK